MPLMGTVVEIQILEGEGQNYPVAFEKAFDEIKRIDSLFSDYKDSSSISLINRLDSGRVVMPKEVVALIKRAIKISAETNGAFDVTVGGLVKLWGFKDETYHVPVKDSILMVIKNIGYSNIEVPDDFTIIKKKNSQLDLSGIAKGYAVDMAYLVLKGLGIKSFLINAGGEIRGMGEDWKTGVQDPFSEQGIVEVIVPGDKAVATSGNYQNYFEVDKIRYCHLFDPKTGFPADKVVSVTVISDDVTIADALATAFFVVGIEKSKELLKKFPGSEFLIIDKDGKKFYSDGFKNYTRS
ncbi:MAG: FAD:protein FMN transferase [Ignavibacteriales bacterium]|nr:FAD:protein FMN transferase [Ignavibacteriales bacterium]